MCANELPFEKEDDIIMKETPMLPTKFEDLNYLLQG